MKVNAATREKIIEHIKRIDDGHGSTDKEKIKMLDEVLNSERKLGAIIESSLDIISHNQGSFGDGRDICNAQRKIWTCRIVKVYM